MNYFTLVTQDGSARRGTFETEHGVFETPNFMPVGTKATVKGVDCERIKEVGAQIILCNTYHLWLRPGHELIERFGGVHRFGNWDGPILSDSGGFQVFSLQQLRKISEEGVAFSSHIDGKKLFLTPELSIEIQEALGVDIAMVLDECPAMDLSRDDTARSLEMTLRWAKRSIEARRKTSTRVFAITQGGRFPDLREHSAQSLAEGDFDGFAIGGLSVGEPKEVMYDVLSYHPAQLPQDRIRYLMGVGTPADIVEAVSRGVDLFDCVMPTRSGRFGRAFVSGDEPVLNVKNARFRESDLPLDESCSCVCCRNYSRAYIHHLFRVEEMLGPVLVSTHNLHYYLQLMQRIRESISAGQFGRLHSEMMGRFERVQIGKSE